MKEYLESLEDPRCPILWDWPVHDNTTNTHQDLQGPTEWLALKNDIELNVKFQNGTMG